jgi:hypothetical protein
LEVADIEGEHATGAQRRCDRDKRAVEGALAGEVVERMSDRDDRVGLGQPLVCQREPANLSAITHDLARDLKHRRRRVGRDHAMAGGDQRFGQLTAAAAELQHQTVPGPHRRQPLDDTRSTRGSMDTKPEVVHQRQVASIVRGLV